MPKTTRLPLFAAAALALSVTACAGASEAGSPSPSTSTVPTTASSVTATPTSTATTSTPPAPRPTARARTAAELTKALLVLKDLPTGFAIESDDGTDGEDDVKVSSKDPRCARLVALTNADTPPGSRASAHQSFSGGEQGPFIDEGLDAMGSAGAVQALQRSFRSAINACHTLTLTVPGQGRSPMAVREVSAPQVGTNPVAVRFTATAGALEGLEVTMVTTGVNDVIVSMSVLAGQPDDVDGATGDAVAKAQKVLSAKSGT
jgi:hypothetical protein